MTPLWGAIQKLLGICSAREPTPTHSSPQRLEIAKEWWPHYTRQSTRETLESF